MILKLHFIIILSHKFFDFLKPDFHGLIFGKIDTKIFDLIIYNHSNNIKLSFFAVNIERSY